MVNVAVLLLLCLLERCRSKANALRLNDLLIEKEGCGFESRYLRFLNSFVPSSSVTYSNPASIRVVASFMLVAVLHVHSSSFRFNSCVYIMVVLI